MALGDYPPAPQVHAHCGGNRADGHSGTSHQRFQKHLRGAGQLAVPAGGRMQTGVGLAAPGTHAAGDAIQLERRFGARRCAPGLGCSRYCFFSGACSARSSFASMP
jgi:hypothetical protein